MSPEQVQQLCQALETEPVVSIRLNDKIDCLTFDADTEEVPWHVDGYYLSRRPQFTLDPLFHAGCYYVQETPRTTPMVPPPVTHMERSVKKLFLDS